MTWKINLSPFFVFRGRSRNARNVTVTRSLTRRLVAVAVIILSSFSGPQVIAVEESGTTASSSIIPAEYATYRYDLVKGKDDKVCKHMGEVYNHYFARLFDFRGFSDEEKFQSVPPLESKYPTSSEFEVVPWQFPKIFTRDGKRLEALPLAKFDIDNDGKNEIVVKVPAGGVQYDSYDKLYVYNNNGLDLSQTITMQRLSEGERKGRPRIIEATILRPFILNGVSYLSVYSFSGPGSPNKRGFIHQPPQTMEVKKYVGGGVHVPAEETPLELEDVCKFNMIRTK